MAHTILKKQIMYYIEKYICMISDIIFYMLNSHDYGSKRDIQCEESKSPYKNFLL